MQVIGALIGFIVFNFFFGFPVWSALAVGIWLGYVVNFLSNINNSIAFRPYILMMYGLNYLFSPALTYEITQGLTIYKMKLSPESYFMLAIPGMFCLHLGLYAIKSNIFKPDFSFTREQLAKSEFTLKHWLIGGVIAYFIRPLLPGDLAFLMYLLSGVRYLAAFGLFVVNKKKYKWYLLGLLFIEVSRSLAEGMFHDMVIWILFFSLLWAYLNKPNALQKLIGGVVAIVFLFLLQSTKDTYRKNMRTGEEGGFGAFSKAFSEKEKTDNRHGEGGLFNMQNFGNSVTRANQGWIFASTVERMQYVGNYQGLTLVGKYAEAAFLPRALAADKLQAGDITIFNQFSGIRILKGTSMGLGLFADGYIGYGAAGVLIFCFVFGLICAYTFKIIEGWSAISPVYVLFMFPLLNYAVRADCETQTWMGHIVKGLLVFTLLIYGYKKYMAKDSFEQEETSDESVLVPAAIGT